jgi:hypothetical protein
MPAKSTIDKTGHREEIEHLLIDLRWGSRVVSQYMEMKYGVSLDDSTIRRWRAKRVEQLKRIGKLKDWDPPKRGENDSPDALIARLMHPSDDVPDVLQKRVALAKLQEERIRADVKHEMAMGKLFNSTAKEVEMLNKLYTEIKKDMQDLGLWPSREAAPSVQINNSVGAVAAAAQAAGGNGGKVEDLPGLPQEEVAAMGRHLLLLRAEKTGE